MLRLCSRTLVGMVKSRQLVNPGSATLVAGRNLSQQNELPKMPVPPLQETFELYLKMLENIVEEKELRRTKELAKEFQKAGGVGERLQRSLQRRLDDTGNWSTVHFANAMYLHQRKPLVIFSNIGIIYPSEPYRNTRADQIRCTAKTIAAKLDVKTMIDNETLPVEYVRGKPLCMKMYENLMSSCRVPGLKEDSLVSYNPSKHITVVHNCQFFKMDAYNSDGTRLTVDQLCVQLERIRSSSLQTNMEPVGILTSQHRDIWSKIYIDLIKDETNKESVSAIESSILTVCLDGLTPSGHNAIAHEMLHGGGSQWNTGNRWFDKTQQFIVAEDGTCGVNFSHAVADGGIFMNFIYHTIEQMEKPQMIRSHDEPLPEPQKLQFNITPEIREAIEEAKKHVDVLIQNLELRFTEFEHFGQNSIKALQMSPDAFVQIAIQMAYYRLHQRCCSTLEGISLRMFREGRLATIDANTNASFAFVKAFDDPNKQNSEKVDLLKEAVKTHKHLCDMARKGKDVVSHFTALRGEAIEQNLPMPDVFTDTSFAKAFDARILIHQAKYNIAVQPLSGPFSPESYVVGYNLRNDSINLLLSYSEVSEPSRENKAARLGQAVEDALLDLRGLLEQTESHNQVV